MNAIECTSCHHKNEFEQPHPYHAGFGNQGFLYNDAGNLTLMWSSFDPTYEAIVGRWHPWALTADQQAGFEFALPEAPSGGRWRFTNPARCEKCGHAISGPITQTIYYLRFPGSVDAELKPGQYRLAEFVSPP